MRLLLVLVGSSVLLETICFTALAPILPGLTEGQTASQIGILAGAYPAGALLAAIPAGMSASRLGPRRTVVGGLLVLAAGSALFGFGNGLGLLDLARFAQGVGSALAWTGGLAWLVRAADSDGRGELLGTAMACSVIGALVGPALGGLAGTAGRGIAFGAVALACLVVAAIAVIVKSPDRGDARQGSPVTVQSLVRAVRRPPIALGWWLIALPGLLFGVLSVLGPLRMHALGYTAAGIAAVFFVGAAVEAASSALLGRWSDRRGGLAPLRAVLPLALALTLVLAWPAEGFLVPLVTGTAAAAYGCCFVPSTVFLSKEAETAAVEQSIAFSLFTIAWTSAFACGSFGGGAVAAATGRSVTYLALAAACAATIILVERSARARPFSPSSQGSVCL